MRASVLGLTLALFLAPALAGQESVPKRPKLPDTKDTSDAAAFYRYGRQTNVSWRNTHAAMYWATRLDPTQDHYVYGRFEAAWAQRPVDWRRRYLEGDKRVVDSREAQQIDSLWIRVLWRDPYPRHPQNVCVIVRGVDDIRDPVWQGSVWFQLGCTDRAAEQWARALERKPELIGLRVDRARALVLHHQYRAAAAELQVVLDTLRSLDSTRLRYRYESKAFLEYMLGVAHRRGNRLDQARQAFARALVEDLSFHPAHVQLAEIAVRDNQLHIAIDEYNAALEGAPNDPAILHAAAEVMLTSGRTAGAEALFRRAVEAEPEFVMAYLQLARCLDRLGKREEAVEQYRNYLARAPEAQSTLRAEAEERMAALGPTSGG